MVSEVKKSELAALQTAAASARQQGREARRGDFLEAIAKAAKQPFLQGRRAGRAIGQTMRGLGQAAARGAPRQPTQRSITLTHASRLAYFAPIINRCAGKYRVPVALICGVMLQESGGNPKAVSPCGARGLMQLMPGTAKRMGVTNIMDPHQNIEGGVRYLRFLLDRFRGNTRLAVAAYNCGEGNVEKYGNRIPPFAETQAYVPNVLAYAETIHRLLGSAGRKV